MARALESWTHAWSWVDWSATGAWMQAWAGFAQAGAVLVVAYKGAGALRTWKLQKVAERRFDTAERIAIASYRLRQAFEDIRIMLIGANELAEARAMLLATEQADEFGQLPLRRQQRTVTAQAMLNRINSHSSEWDELLALIPVSQAFMAPEIAEKLSSIWKMRGHLIVSAGMYAEDFADDPGLLEKIRQDLYQGVARENNEINMQLEEAFSTIERLLKPILQDAGEASSH